MDPRNPAGTDSNQTNQAEGKGTSNSAPTLDASASGSAAPTVSSKDAPSGATPGLPWSGKFKPEGGDVAYFRNGQLFSADGRSLDDKAKATFQPLVPTTDSSDLLSSDGEANVPHQPASTQVEPVPANDSSILYGLNGEALNGEALNGEAEVRLGDVPRPRSFKGQRIVLDSSSEEEAPAPAPVSTAPSIVMAKAREIAKEIKEKITEEGGFEKVKRAMEEGKAEYVSRDGGFSIFRKIKSSTRYDEEKLSSENYLVSLKDFLAGPGRESAERSLKAKVLRKLVDKAELTNEVNLTDEMITLLAKALVESINEYNGGVQVTQSAAAEDAAKKNLGVALEECRQSPNIESKAAALIYSKLTADADDGFKLAKEAIEAGTAEYTKHSLLASIKGAFRRYDVTKDNYVDQLLALLNDSGKLTKNSLKGFVLQKLHNKPADDVDYTEADKKAFNESLEKNTLNLETLKEKLCKLSELGKPTMTYKM